MGRDSFMLNEVFSSLNAHNVKYCVMNSYEELPEKIPTDVDIAVDRRSFDKIDELLLRLCEQHDMAITQKIHHGYHKIAYILSPLAIDRRFRLHLDFFTDFSVNGYPNLIFGEDILNSATPLKNYFIPSPSIEAPFITMRRIVKNDIKLSHIAKLKALRLKSPEIDVTLKSLLGSELYEAFLSVLDQEDPLIFSRDIDLYRKALKKWSRRNTDIPHYFRYYAYQLKRLFGRMTYPVGLAVAFLSPDGGGKSTIAKLVLERVSGSFIGGKIIYSRPYLLPAIGRLKYWNPSEERSTNPSPHDYPKQGVIKSFVRFFYYLLDYVIGYLINVYIEKVKRKIIIFDRYYYDYLIDIKRYQYNMPRIIPRCFLSIIPSPDMTFYLYAEPKELLRRKQELPLEELERQVREFKELMPRIPNSHMISTERPIEEVVSEISYLILKEKAGQTRKILKLDTSDKGTI